jgi:hypothetical protein
MLEKSLAITIHDGGKGASARIGQYIRSIREFAGISRRLGHRIGLWHNKHGAQALGALPRAEHQPGFGAQVVGHGWH